MIRQICTIGLLVLFSRGITQHIPCPSHPQDLTPPIAHVYDRSSELIIPIVFHLVEEEGASPIDISEIMQILDLLNSAFFNEGITTSYAYGTPGHVGFQFKLAEKDPEGMETSGIIRKSTSEINIGDLTSGSGQSYIKQDDFGGSDPWDLENYVNVWIGERTLSLGSTIAFNTRSEDLEGIVLSRESLSSSPKTLAHEMGHYFGLLHPWGNFTGCDDEEDGIADTPFQSFPDFECMSVFNCSNNTMPGNIMDFSEDDCLIYFSRQQADLIQQNAFNFKSALINSNDCFIENLPSTVDLLIINDGFESLELYANTSEPLVDIALFSIDGKMIKSINANGQSFLNIPTNGIPTGIYVLVLSRGNDKIVKKIFIK